MKIACDRATIGGVIDRLEQKKYVSRSVSRRDRRAREILLISEGKQVFSALQPVVSALQDEMLERLEDTERAIFLALMHKAINHTHD